MDSMTIKQLGGVVGTIMRNGRGKSMFIVCGVFPLRVITILLG